MRTQLFVAFAMSSLVACGGEDAPSTPDAKVYMDAPPDMTPACLAESPPGALSLGSTQMRSAGDYFVVPTSGPQMGKTVFFMGAGLPGSTATAADVLAFEYVEPDSGGFVTDAPVSFETNGAAGTYVAASYILADYNSTAKTIGQVFWASSGALTLTDIGESDGSMITGSVNTTNYREISQTTGMDVSGGCTASLMGLSFALTQMEPAMPFAPDKTPAGELVELSQADMLFLYGEIERLKSLRGQQ